MKSSYFAFILLLNVVFAHSQNWQPFALGETHHFQSDTANFPDRSLRIDSVRGNAADSVWHFNRMWEQISGNTANANSPNFCGRSLRIKTDGLFQFFDPLNIAIYSQANLGDSWMIDSVHQRIGTVYRIFADSILGEWDSIKVIQVGALDSIVLSKTHGLVEWPAILGPCHYTLVGIQERHLGDTLPGFSGFFNFRPEEVMFWKSQVYQVDIAYTTVSRWHTKMVVDSISRDSTGQHISYTVYQRYYLDNDNVGIGRHITGVWDLLDTVGGLVSRTNGESFPYEYCTRPYDFDSIWAPSGPGAGYLGFYYTDPAWLTLAYRKENDTLKMRLGQNNWNSVPAYTGAVPSLVTVGAPRLYQEAEFQEGLGITRSKGGWFEAGTEFELVGHILEGDTVGTYWTEEELTGTTGPNEPRWVVWPNPVGDALHVSFYGHAGGIVRVLDLTGKVLLEAEGFEERLLIDVHTLPVGMYLLVNESEGERLTRRLVISR